jgi:hypothetical protein
MNVKQLLLDIREALGNQDQGLANRLVGNALTEIEGQEETDKADREEMLYKDGILRLENVQAILDKEGVNALLINATVAHQYRINGIYVSFDFRGGRFDGEEPEDVNLDVWDQFEQDTFNDWFGNRFDGWDESQAVVTDAWGLIALFGEHPDPKLLQMVLQHKIILDLTPDEVASIFNNWERFYNNWHMWTGLQERKMFNFEQSSDS